MDTLRIVLDLFVLAGLGVVGWLLKSYFPAYLQEKGKNLATKEDIGAITHAVEGVKIRYSQELEQLRATLQRESEVVVRRREVYEQLIHGLRIFVRGQFAPGDTSGPDFVAAYRSAWLWAPDEVILEFNHLIELNRFQPDNPQSQKEIDVRQAYLRAVLRLRRGAGHPDTRLSESDYQFFSV